MFVHDNLQNHTTNFNQILLMFAWLRWDWADYVCCMHHQEQESSRSGCQKTGVVAERGLKNAGVMIWTRLCEIGWSRLHTSRSGSLWGDLCPAVG